MEGFILQSLSGAGAALVLGVVIFFMYRRECKNHRDRLEEMHEQFENKLREDRMFMEDRLTKLLQGDQQSREENTKVLAELVTYLKLLNGKIKQS